MDFQTLLARMTDPAAPAPFVRDIQASFAVHLATVADKLTEEELQRFIELGTAIGRRTTKLVPVIGSVN